MCQKKHRLFLAITVALSVLPAAQAQTGPDDATEAVELDRLVVRPQFEAQARAIDLKRDSDAILDAVSSDEMGNYPDQNVAESLQRIPGISVTRDQGEGRFVVIRGLNPNLNNVSVDGLEIGTPESGARQAPMDVIPSESTERLKVVKSATPDMPGDSIGGSIQIESASAFDRDGRNFRAKLEANHQDLSGETSPKASVNYSDQFADGTFGVAMSLNYQDRKYESDNSEGEYDGDEGEELFLVEWQRRKYFVERERIGANLNLDWRPDDDNRYYVRTLFSSFKDSETRQRTVFGFGDGEVESLGNGDYAITELPSDAISKRLRYRTKKQDTLAASFGGENRLEQAVLDYQLGYTKTRERANDEVEARFDYDGDDLEASVHEGSGMPSFSLSDAGWMDNANYAFDRFVVSPTQVDDEEYSAKINVRFDGEHSSYKFGLLGRWRERDVNVDEIEYREGPDVDLSEWTTAAPDHRHGTLGQGLSSAAMRAYWAAHAGEYSVRDKDLVDTALLVYGDDYTAKENILAAYAMGTWDIGMLRIIGGVRVENTQFTGSGNRIDVEDGGDSFVLSQVGTHSSYTSVLPGLHLRWDLGDWALRASANKSIARPGFEEISPHVTVNNDDAEVEMGNPDLDPYESTNIDLSLERYLGDSGIVSLGLFHKSIDGYIAEVQELNSDEFAGYDVSTWINGEDATVYGVELNWQQALDFLPEGWNGLMVGLSGTWNHTEFDPGLDGRSEKLELPQSSKRVYSAYLGYEKYGISTRVSAVHRSEYLDELGKSNAYDIYVAAHTQLDFSLDYSIGKHVKLYFDASNLLDKPLERYQGTKSYTQQYEEYGRTYAAGVKVNF